MLWESLRPTLASYWSAPEIQTNLIILLNLLGAMVLGGLVGYERSFHGRAAGVRTYSLVCMASTAVTAMAGYPELWFGAYHGLAATPDPTRVIQGIVTGIGFLGAGVIVKDGMHITGLASAASIWAASCIGVLLGVGFYPAAIALALLSVGTMLMGNQIKNRLPAHRMLGIQLQLSADCTLGQAELRELLRPLGYQIVSDSYSMQCDTQHREIKCVTVLTDKKLDIGMDGLARTLRSNPDVVGLSLNYTRN